MARMNLGLLVVGGAIYGDGEQGTRIRFKRKISRDQKT